MSNLIPKPKEPAPRLTLCLAMDLKGSTTSGLQLSTKKLDRFNLALVDQLGPHLRAVQLEHATVKFTGDGWLVMSDEQDDAAKLCCLAMIMARRFRFDIENQTGFSADNIPAMRLALCWGRDLPVTLLNGQRDFVGSSVRHAVRACQLCRDNEILVDETVRSWIALDFTTHRCPLDDRIAEFSPAKMEEEFVLHTLEHLKVESADDDDAPIYFVNTLAIIGRTADADRLANQISERLLTRASSDPLNQEEILQRWNELLSSSLDHDTAREVLEDLMASGLKPDEGTFNALLEKADSPSSEDRWFQLMLGLGIRPSLQTFHILLGKATEQGQLSARYSLMAQHAVPPTQETARILITRAADYRMATDWVRELRAKGVVLDGEGHENLLRKAPDFPTAQAVLSEMIAEGWEPSESAFIAAFSKGVTSVRADDLLHWYLGLKYHPTHPIKRAIADYRKAGQFEDALRLSLDYPHTDTALKTIRQNPSRALHYFEGVVEHDPNHANGAYAMGMALLELDCPGEAVPWLRRAYDLAGPGTRKDELARYLSLFEKVVPDIPQGEPLTLGATLGS